MPKTLHLNVYCNPKYRKCAAGGLTETADELHLICDEGPFDAADDDPQLAKLVTRGSIVHIEPVNPANKDAIGPMFGGNFAYTSDSRFSQMVKRAIGHDFYGAVPVHDRWESQAVYDALSR